MKIQNSNEKCWNNQTRSWVNCDTIQKGRINPSPPSPSPSPTCCMPKACCIQCADIDRWIAAIKQANLVGSHPSAPWAVGDGISPTANELLQLVVFVTGVDIRSEALSCFVNPFVPYNDGQTPTIGNSIIQPLFFVPSTEDCGFFSIAWEYRVGGPFGYELANVRVCVDATTFTQADLYRCRACTASVTCRCQNCITENGEWTFEFLPDINAGVNVYQQSVAPILQQMYVDTLTEQGISTVQRPNVGYRLVNGFTPKCQWIDIVPQDFGTYIAADTTEYYFESYNVYVQADQGCPQGSARAVNINGATYYLTLLTFIQESVAPFNYLLIDYSINGPTFDPTGSGSFTAGFCNF